MKLDDIVKEIIKQAEMLHEKHPEKTVYDCVYVVTDMVRRYAQWLC